MFRMMRERYLDQPHEVSLETFAKCNARCTFCPYPTLERINEKMPWALIERLVGEMSEWTRPFFFSPFKVNEPLLDKRFYAICQQVNARVPLARLRIFTNGSPLTEERIAEIADLKNVEHLWISLNSTTPDEYKELMGLRFSLTAQRLDVLHATEGFPHRVVLSAVGLDKAATFKAYCNKRWPKFAVFTIKQDSWLGYVSADKPAIPNTPCVRWFELSIMANGIVSLCCMDGEGDYAIGDVNKNTLLEVYNAPHWRDRREMLVSRKTIHPCSTCSY